MGTGSWRSHRPPSALRSLPLSDAPTRGAAAPPSGPAAPGSRRIGAADKRSAAALGRQRREGACDHW